MKTRDIFTAVSLLVFPVSLLFLPHRSITQMSLMPIVSGAIMLFMFFVYRSGDINVGASSYQSMIYSDEKKARRMSDIRLWTDIILRIIPLQFVFVLYFADAVKAVGAVLTLILPMFMFAIIRK